ncbi:MAG: PAS domain-containing sensor histidine kinase [Alphaproteobacteria bacterium]|nr:PAS domain-containing sensor histidine kinase [Alphaproteobacteria bacterium]
MKSVLSLRSTFAWIRSLFRDPQNKPDEPIKDRKTFLQRYTLSDNLALFLSIAAILLGAATYAALTRTPFFGSDPTTISIFLLLDLIVLVTLGSLVARRIYQIWSKRRKNQAASRLHIRVVSVFTMLAAAPAVLVVMFATVFFYFGVEAWFSERVSTALDESQEVAQAYLKEHQQVLRADALSMANDLNRQAVRLSEDPMKLAQTVSAQAYLRSLTEVIVFDGAGKILARSGLTFALSFEPITDEMRERARAGDVVLVVSDNDDRVRALLRLDNFVDTYLFVGRLVEPKVLAHMESTQKAVTEYHDLKEHSSGIRVMISIIFVVVAMLLLLTAVWFGLNFATSLVRPISALINATDRVRSGDLAARVEELSISKTSDDELADLGRAFNRMIGQLEAQRGELVEANRQLDTRRRFTEAVLAGVSASVIGLDPAFKINMMNAQATEFFQITDPDALTGHSLEVLAPEIDALIKEMPRSGKLKDGQVEIRRTGLPTRTILVRVSSEVQGGDVRGYVITFDDVTELVAAQRKAAWADVARRIAHEIKNPLTPIQLSADRLRRKYMKEITSDPETFQVCTDTIIRHVEDIGRMVDEFSSFARLPVPVIKPHELVDLCRQTVFLQSSTRTDIIFTQDLPDEKITCDCDGRQIAQALTNLLKNAAEAIDGRPDPSSGALPPGQIHLSLAVKDEHVELAVADNGRGLPVEERARLTEPYVTTRSKGTGLGLAIVKKIMEDHKGVLELRDNNGGGAVVVLSWPLVQESNRNPDFGRIEKV